MMPKKSNKIKITWIRSQIGHPRAHRRTIRALGLHRLNQSVETVDTPPVRGMIESVRYMLRVEEVEG